MRGGARVNCGRRLAVSQVAEQPLVCGGDGAGRLAVARLATARVRRSRYEQLVHGDREHSDAQRVAPRRLAGEASGLSRDEAGGGADRLPMRAVPACGPGEPPARDLRRDAGRSGATPAAA